MQILTLLPDDSLQRLRAALSRTADIRPQSAERLSAVLRSVDRGIVVVDPRELRDDSFQRLLDAVARAGAPLLYYGRLCALTSARAVAASGVVPFEFVFLGASDEAAILRIVIATSSERSVPSLVFEGLVERIALLPERLRDRVIGLFGWLPVPESVSALKDIVHAQGSAIGAWLHAAQLCSASALLRIARLARAYESLSDGSETLDAIALAHGFGSARTLDHQSHLATGLAPRQAGHLDRQVFANQLCASVCR